MFFDTRQSTAVASAQPLPAQAAAGESALDVAYLVRALWNRQRTIYIAIAICMIAALLFGQLAAARYTASVQVLIDPNDLRVVENGLRGQNQFTETHVTQVENQIRVLMSNNVAKRVVERLALDRDPEFIAPGAFDVRAALRTLFGMKAAGHNDPALDAMLALRKRISSKRADRTYVVDVGVWAYEPQKAVALAGALVESFLAEQSAARGEAARRASGSLNARLSELRERVQQAEQRVEDYKRANGIISSSGTLVNERQVTELNSQLILARTRTAEAKARYDKVKEIQRNHTDPGAIGEAVGSATITALRSQLAEILRRDGEINATLGKRHPAVIEIESQVRRIRRLIEEEVARIGEAARNDMERAMANEATLAANLERLKSALENTNEASVRLRELERDVQASRTVYEAYLVRTREVTEQEQLDTTSTRVLAPPELPEYRSFPPRNLVLLMAGGMLGGMLGVGFALLGEWRERRAPTTFSREAAMAPVQTSAVAPSVQPAAAAVIPAQTADVAVTPATVAIAAARPAQASAVAPPVDRYAPPPVRAVPASSVPTPGVPTPGAPASGVSMSSVAAATKTPLAPHLVPEPPPSRPLSHDAQGHNPQAHNPPPSERAPEIRDDTLRAGTTATRERSKVAFRL